MFPRMTAVKTVRKTTLNGAALARMAQVLRLLAHPGRLRIIERLEAESPAPVHRLVERTGFSQAALSHHLGLLRRVGLVAAERRGKEVWYRLDDPRSLTILGCMRKQKGGGI